jgi:hypothetical protein
MNPESQNWAERPNFGPSSLIVQLAVTKQATGRLGSEDRKPAYRHVGSHDHARRMSLGASSSRRGPDWTMGWSLSARQSVVRATRKLAATVRGPRTLATFDKAAGVLDLRRR